MYIVHGAVKSQYKNNIAEEDECLFQHSSLVASTDTKLPYSTVRDCKDKCDSSKQPCLGFTVVSGDGQVGFNFSFSILL